MTGWIPTVAVYFVIWWTVLFIALPFGLKTQDDDKNVTLGTEASAPRGPHMLRAIIITTILACIIYGTFYYLTRVLGLGFDDFPKFVPDYQ
jgi:predicted secreted protein